MDPEKVKQEFPSICYDCKNSRRLSSDENAQKGYVGCAEYTRRWKSDNCNVDFVTVGDFLGEGWVDLRSYVFGKPSGISTNFQLITRGIKVCQEFEQKQE